MRVSYSIKAFAAVSALRTVLKLPRWESIQAPLSRDLYWTLLIWFMMFAFVVALSDEYDYSPIIRQRKHYFYKTPPAPFALARAYSLAVSTLAAVSSTRANAAATTVSFARARSMVQ